MSKAEELLDSLSIEDIQPFTSQPDIEGHIVIDKDRIIRVPTELKRIAVQYDANIETVTFDCPRYWDEHDLSEMNIYINYKLPGNLINNIGQSLVKNLRINEDDENIINFDWTIGPILTNNKGDLPFSVCAKSKTNQDSDEAIRWYTEINTELTISEGMDGSGDIEDNYEDLFPDVINDIISKLEGINSTYDEKLEAFNTNATSKTESFDTNAETRTTEFNNNATTKTNEFNSNAIEKTEAFNANANSVLKKSNAFINGLMNAALTNEVEGVENVINDGIECPLFKMEVDGHTNEQVVTQGYNLLPNNLSSQNINGITITKNNDGSITLNGTTTKSTSLVIADLTNFSLQGTYNFYLIGKNDKINLQGIEDGETVAYLPYSYNTNNYITKEYDTAKNLTKIFSYIGSGVTFNNETFKYMITQGSDLKNYEPYTGGQPSPSPDYPQEIDSIEGSLEFDCNGRNLLPNTYENEVKNGLTITPNNDGSVTINGTSSNTVNYQLYGKPIISEQLPIHGNYISGGIQDVKINVINYNGTNYNILATNNSGFTKIDKSVYDKGYIELRIEANKTFNNKTIYPMLSNEQNVDWESYIEPNQVTFNLNGEKLRSVGDVKDELVVDLVTGDYYKVENVKDVILTGTRFWGKATEGNITDGFSAYTTISDISYVSGSANKILKCNKLKGVLYSDENIRNITNVVFGGYGNIVIVNVDRKYLDTPDINGFKNWVANNNVLLCYQLATPTTKKLGTLDADQLLKLATFKGYNYITVTGIVDGESVNLNSRITYIQNANEYREIQNGKIAKMISNHPKQNMEGIDNTFDDAVDMELFELGGDGKSEQKNTTGTQLFNANAIVNSDIVVNDNGKTIKMPVVSDGNGSIITNVTLQELCPTLQVGDVVYLNFERNLGLTYNNFIQLAGSGTIWYVNTSHEITQSELEGAIYLYGNRFVSGETEQCILTNFRITKGQNDLFEPFSNGIPSPSPDYEQPINSIEGSVDFTCRGKNLLNATREEYVSNGLTVSFDNSNMYINGATTQNSKYIGTSYKLGKGTYTLSLNILKGNITSSDTGAIFYLYEGTSYHLLNKAITLKSNTKGYSTFTLDKETNVTLGLFARITETFNNVVLQYQVTKGENPDYNFEPYVEPNQVTFNLNGEKLRSVENVKDELVVDLDTGDYYKFKNIEHLELAISNMDNSENYPGWVNAEKINEYYPNINNIIGAILQLKSNITINTYSIGFNTIGQSSVIWLEKGKFNLTQTQWKEQYPDLVFKLDYSIPSTETIKLGTLSSEDLAKLKTLKGYNNVTVNTNLGLMNIRFTYGLDVKKYLDNKIAEISEQMIKGE